MPPRRADPRLRALNHRIGTRIRMRRRAWRIPMAKLARAVGVSSQQISKYETGRDAITAARLHDIAHHLQVPITWFFEESDGGM